MNVTDTIKAFGCHDVVSLDDKPNSGHLDYLDLLKASGNHGLKVNAVAEFQARPLLYIVSANQLSNNDNDKIIELQRMLANRGERAYLGILSPGELNVYPINLARAVLAQGYKQTIRQDEPEAPLFFQNVINGLFELDGQPDAPDYVFDEIHRLLNDSSKYLIETYHLKPLDVLSFLGRALFFRFLCDRGIVRQNELDTVCPTATEPADCFRNAVNSIATCRWLDETFNGDLLPLSGSFEEVFEHADTQTQGALFSHLRAILEGSEHTGNGLFQLKINWGDLDFAHIPIGVLSQVYESFSRMWDSQRSENTSVYYTPKNIARYLVDDAFAGVANKKDAHILDPSCGAGIFLVLAFRKLVAARWKEDGKRPDTKIILDILYKQLCGFDVSESALRLAALSLYITAIELNDSPRPPKSLKFPKPLQGRVLYNHRRPEEQDSNGFVLGSLRPDLSEEFNGRFDLVIGNPPWSSLKGESEESKKTNKAHNFEFTSLTRQILIDRGLADIAKKYNNPGNNPDLPFLWKSAHWAKPGGVVAMALPSRIFLKQSPAGTSAFNAILRGIEITGILNGSNLADTKIWPGMSQPFMLLFARNQVPGANHHFHFVTPHFEKRLNDKGRIRIDFQSAQPIDVAEVINNTWLLKTLAVGTSLDADVFRKFVELNWSTVKSCWKCPGLYSGRGYDLSPDQRQYDAEFMYDLPDFSPPVEDGFSVDVQLLHRFKRHTAHMPRCIELYSPPLIIVPQSPGASLTSVKSYLLNEATVFSQSYYGFSANDLSDVAPVALLHLLTHSELFSYYLLMTSSRMGAERRTMTKSDLEEFPFPEIDQLSKSQRQRLIDLSKQLETAATKPWQALNDFIFNLYGLDEYDRQVVKDTLEVSPPYKEARDRANGAPSKKDRNAFYAELHRLLAPSFAVTDETVLVDEVVIAQHGDVSPWYFFSIASTNKSADLTQTTRNELISQIAEEANKKGCSRVTVHEDGCLLVGIIGQYRYWTLSRARLCALDILRNHLDVFPVGRI
ncbi:MAG: N-6 DNA methylase [Geobacteraceae bacterium]|nr:N-6 DNA methylase [Geobacteraceae bacterium]